MPLLIASFAFNFNNFNLVYIFNNGNPPMADTIIPIGQTDILISFIYKLAFVTSGAPLRARRGDRRSRCSWWSARSPGSRSERRGRSRNDEHRSLRRSRRSWWWRFPLAALMIGFALLPVLWVVSASLNPAKSLVGASLIPEQPELRQLRRPHQPPLVSIRDVAVELDQDHRHLGQPDGDDHDARRLRPVAVPVRRQAGVHERHPDPQRVPSRPVDHRPVRDDAADRHANPVARPRHPLAG